MNRFWILFERSVIITGTLSVLLVVGALVITIQGREVPVWLLSAVSMVLGFFFGSKSGTAQNFRKGE